MDVDEAALDGALERADGRERSDLLNPDVLTKFRTAAEIANQALALVLSRCAPGAVIAELCHLGDSFVLDATSRIYNRKDDKGRAVIKGIGFPTCVCRNNVIQHYSPGAEDRTALQAGDLVKVDVGVHIDGYLAVAAHTVVLAPGPVRGRAADAIAACFTAAECVTRLCRPGVSSEAVTDAIMRSAAQFGCEPVRGTASRQMQRFRYLTDRFIPSTAAADDEKLEPFEFEPGQAYSFDLVMSTGSGTPLQSEARANVLMRDTDVQYQLKTRVSRHFLADVNSRFPCMPFPLRAFADQVSARAGVAEGLRHDLLLDFPVTQERPGELVARLRITVLLTPSGTARVTGLPVDPTALHTTRQIQSAELSALLSQPVWTSRRGKRSKPKSAPKAVVLPEFVAPPLPAGVPHGLDQVGAGSGGMDTADV